MSLPPPPDLEPVETYDDRLNAWYEVCQAILSPPTPETMEPDKV